MVQHRIGIESLRRAVLENMCRMKEMTRSGHCPCLPNNDVRVKKWIAQIMPAADKSCNILATERDTFRPMSRMRHVSEIYCLKMLHHQMQVFPRCITYTASVLCRFKLCAHFPALPIFLFNRLYFVDSILSFYHVVVALKLHSYETRALGSC